MGNLKTQRYDIEISDPSLIPENVLFWFNSYIKNDHDYHPNEESLQDYINTLDKKIDFKIEGNCETSYPTYLIRYIHDNIPIPRSKIIRY